MRRGILKDKELQWMSQSDIEQLSSDSANILFASVNQENGYFIGYNGGGIAVQTDTSICSSLHMKAYINSKLNENIILKINDSLIYKEGEISEIDELPVSDVNRVILSNTYNDVTRYLGVNGTSICSTTEQETAVTDDKYYWNMEYAAAGQFKLYNPKSGRYINYSTSSPYYNINTNGTNLYLAYNNENGFTICNTNSTSWYSTKYYMGFNNDTSLTRQNSAQYWHIYSTAVSPIPSDDGEIYSTNELEELPVATVNDVLLSNGPRYLGLTTSNGVTSTTNIDDALNNNYYHWNIIYYSANRFKIQNSQTTGRYIRYNNNSFSISTSNTNLYFSYNDVNKYTIMGSNGSNYMFMSSNTALARNQYTAQYWNIYSIVYRYPVKWEFAAETMSFQNIEPVDISKIVAGYNPKELISIKYGDKILCHGDSENDLYYYDVSQDYQDAWVIFNAGEYIIPKDKPIEPEIKLLGAKYYYNEVETGWEITYAYREDLDKFDITIVAGGVHCGFLLYREDDSRIDATKITWDSLKVINNNTGREIDPSTVEDCGWCSTTAGTNNRQLVNGGNIGIGTREDIETGISHPYAVGFTSGSDMSPNASLTLEFKGVKFV